MNKIPGKVWTLAVVLDEVIKEGDDMETLAQVGGLLCDMVVNGTEMVVVCEAVQVDPYLDTVAFIQKGCCEVLPRKSLTGLELDPARQDLQQPNINLPPFLTWRLPWHVA